MPLIGTSNRHKVVNPNNPKHPADTIPAGQGGAVISQLSGGPTTGGVLFAEPGFWSAYPPPVFSYAWYADATNTGITSKTYTILVGNIGKTMTCRVSASNSAGNSASPNISNGIAIV